MGDDGSAPYPEIAAMAREAEAAGLDSLWVFDHMLSSVDEPASGPWEAWTLLGALAAVTRSARLGTLVACTGFRNPALLAKMAHTIQEISGGRLILGIGAGWHEPEYRAFGYPFDHRVDRFTEAIEIIARLLRGERVTFTGKHSTVDNAVLRPELSTGPTSTPILVGTGGERMLRLTARWADAWNTAWYGLPNARFDELSAKLRDACAAERRDPSTVEVTVGLLIGGDERPARVEHDPGAIADVLHAWQDKGVGQVLCWPEPTTRESLDALVTGYRRFRNP
jgi:probable F420-dependent oxidoreductase